jgi:LuxR family maltose regulon positive regulatory protein
MPDPLVHTKLVPPGRGRTAVPRPRLEALLGRGTAGKLTLLAAPAGFGKTTLLATWFTRDAGHPTAWVSLDERDQDPQVFWSYLLLAIERAAPETASAALNQLRSGQGNIDAVVSSLLNELSVLASELCLVLDDYHLADCAEVRPGMTFLLKRLPPQVHVVIATRVDPALPLARLRASGELVELRAADLRFTTAEATAYLNEARALALEPDDVDRLETRTEGWAAALQLAALSLEGREDPSAFIAGFAGDDRFVVDYLADEVLDRQPGDVRRFLLESSVLERMSASLCDAALGRSDGQKVLELLERQNLFVVPLDDRREWYRYHHLFADVLRARLMHADPGAVAGLHRRASSWFTEAGQPEYAVAHALASGDEDLAAGLVELAIPGMLRERKEAVVRRWMHQLPDQVATQRPVLAIGFIGALMSSNDFGDIDRRLQAVERLLVSPEAEQIVVDEREHERLPAAAETYRSALQLVNADLSGAVEHAHRALAVAPAEDHLSIASASALIGIASWTEGDLKNAHDAYRTASDNLSLAGHVADVMGCAVTLADIEMTQGKLQQAQQTLEGALVLDEPLDVPLRGAADMHVGLSRVCRERGDLAGAAHHLRRADDLGDGAGLPRYSYRWRSEMAQLQAARGDEVAAIALLDDAERLYVADFAPDVRPVSATRARLLVTTGDVNGALAWAHQRGVLATDPLTYLHEYDHLTLARALLADHERSGRLTTLDDATSLLAGLLAAAQAGGRTHNVIEALALQALASDAVGHATEGASVLEAALTLAEPEGHVDVFTSLRAPMLTLLKGLLRRRRDWDFLQRVLSAFAQGEAPVDDPVDHSVGPPHDSGAKSGPHHPQTAPSPLVEPLSSREIDVLRLLRSDLGGPEIARELGVSLSTVRTHTQHIYTKLGVRSRRAAVRRAHQHNLYARAGRL